MKTTLHVLLLAVLVSTLALPGVHVHHHHDHHHENANHETDEDLALSHLLLDASLALFDHAHEQHHRTAHTLAHHDGSGFHIHLLQKALQENRPTDSAAPEFAVSKSVPSTTRDATRHGHRVSRANLIFASSLSGHQFITRLTSLPPPQSSLMLS